MVVIRASNAYAISISMYLSLQQIELECFIVHLHR